MTLQASTRIVLLPPTLWLGTASLTLAGALLYIRQRQARFEGGAWDAVLEVYDSQANVALGLLGLGELLGERGDSCSLTGNEPPESTAVEVCGRSIRNRWPPIEIRNLPGFNIGREERYLRGLLKGLCSTRNARTLKLNELAYDLAEAICTGCPTLPQPVEPLILVRTEFYEFSRSFGGSRAPSSEFRVADRLRFPAVAQALALLAHYATTIYRASDFSLSLALHPESIIPSLSSPSMIYNTVKYYAKARCTLSKLAEAWEGGVPESLLSLLTALEGVELRLGGMRSFDLDSLVIARLSLGEKRGGGRRKVSPSKRLTLQKVDVIPVSALAILLEEAILSMAGSASALRGLARTALVAARRLAVDSAGVSGASPQDLKRLGRARRALVEYSNYMLEASFKLAACRRPVEEAYAAARVMGLAARDLAGASSGQVRGFAGDAELLSRLASSAAGLDLPRHCYSLGS